MLEFGFTSCPDVCPKTLAALASVRKKLGAQAGDVQVVYVTVDPERDDAERLRTHLAKFDPTFLGGTGTAEELEAVRKEYGIAAKRVKAGEATHAYSHSSFTYLIDRAGSLRALVPYDTPGRRHRPRPEDPARAVRPKRLILLAIALGALGWGGWAGLAPIESRLARGDLRDSEWHLGAPHVGRSGRDPAQPGPPHARRARRAPAREPRRRPAALRPTLLMPGQSFRLPFTVASENVFTCTAHASGQMTVIVEPLPATRRGRGCGGGCGSAGSLRADVRAQPRMRAAYGKGASRRVRRDFRCRAALVSPERARAARSRGSRPTVAFGDACEPREDLRAREEQRRGPPSTSASAPVSTGSIWPSRDARARAAAAVTAVT